MKTKYIRRWIAAFLMCLMCSLSASAQTDAPVLDSGNTAWMITATILVLLMSIPGIALFYGGLVRQKNILSVIMQTLFIVAAVSIIWIVFGYSWAFDTSFAEQGHPLAAVIGGFDKAFLDGIGTRHPDYREHSRVDLCHVPVYVCPDHAGADPRCVCRKNQVFGLHRVHSPVGGTGLSAYGPLGMGRRFPAADGSH